MAWSKFDPDDEGYIRLGLKVDLDCEGYVWLGQRTSYYTMIAMYGHRSISILISRLSRVQ